MEKTLVVTNDQVTALVARLREQSAIGFDTEVSGPALLEKDMVNVYASTLTGFSVAFGEEAFYVPVSHRRGTNCYDWRRAMSEIFDPAREREIWAHNWQFDLKVVHAAGFSAVEDCKIRCSLIAAWLMQAEELGLKVQAKRVLGMTMTSFHEVSKGQAFDNLSPQEALSYAADDAMASLRLGDHYASRIKAWDPELYRTFTDLEMPLVRVLSHMETSGMPIDENVLGGLRERLKPIADGIYEDLYWTYGFNPASGKQLSEWGFGGKHWGTEGIEKGKNGLYKTNADAIAAVVANHATTDLGREVAEKVLEWRAAEKLVSTYTSSLLDKAAQYPDRRLHCEYNHTGTRTGRLSSSYPNLQNIPVQSAMGKTIREAFVAPPGRVFVSADYSQIELRILAHMAGEGRLLSAYREGRDLHQQTADIIGSTRNNGKTFNFAVVYGAQAKRISKTLGVPRKDAQTFVERFKAGYPEIASYDERVVQATRYRGYVRTLAKRFRMLPDITADDMMARWAAERRARNTPIQGGARDVMSRAMVNIYEHLRTKGNPGNVKMIAQIHDDVMFEVDEAYAGELEQLVKREMETAWPGLKCPLVTEPTTAKRWSDMK
jgi:DNA polymerase I